MSNIMNILDMDNTICSPKQKMDEGFASRFQEWAKTNEFVIVTGATIEDVLIQIPLSILSFSHSIFCSSGNATYLTFGMDKTGKGPELAKQTEFIECQALLDLLDFHLKYSTWGPKFGNHVERRLGAINFSIPGRSCSDEWRKKYFDYDNHDGERRRICNEVNEKFPQYTCSVGGMISCDIVMKGCDKSQILSQLDLSSKLKFFGDRCNSGENDYELAKAILDGGYGEVIPVKNWENLQELLGLTPVVEIPKIGESDEHPS